MAQIERLEVKNFKVLADVSLGQAHKPHAKEIRIGPFSVFLGPNGCGKSTLFDVFGFLAQCLQTNVSDALAQRGGFEEVRSREKTGPITFTISYRHQPDEALMTYRLQLNLKDGRPMVEQESLGLWDEQTEQSIRFLDFENGQGLALAGDQASEDKLTEQAVDKPDILAIKGLGQLASYPHIANLRRFIEGWYLSYFVPNLARNLSETGYAEHLSALGDNLSNYSQYLKDKHPKVFQNILQTLTHYIPKLDVIDVEKTFGMWGGEAGIVLKFKDRPFHDPFVARFVSDGTLKMFAYLALLNDPNPPPLLCIEEPENGLHPQLLGILVEELRAHSSETQVFISSHSPHLVDYLEPHELWLMDRDKGGYAQVKLATETMGIEAFLKEGFPLGDLWMRKHLDGGTL